jgi:hypothetical protein
LCDDIFKDKVGTPSTETHRHAGGKSRTALGQFHSGRHRRKIRINVKKGEDSAQNAQRRSAVVDFLITGEYFLGRLPGSIPRKNDVKIL